MMSTSSSGFGRHLPGNGRPAKIGGMAPDNPPITMFLRRKRLQHHGVDAWRSRRSGERQPHGDRVDEAVQRPQPVPPTHPGERKRFGEFRSPRGNGRPRVRAISASIFCSTRQFNHRRRPGHQPDAHSARNQHLQRHCGRGGGQEHADDRAEHDQPHHRGLVSA